MRRPARTASYGIDYCLHTSGSPLDNSSPHAPQGDKTASGAGWSIRIFFVISPYLEREAVGFLRPGWRRWRFISLKALRDPP
jgi:hypothetical protein